MKPGWYILNYHDVNWESSYFTRAIGGVVSPDLFCKHVEKLSKKGKIISVQTGLELLKNKTPIQKPLFS